MALILILCFAFLMFYLAHSTLLHYLAEEIGGGRSRPAASSCPGRPRAGSAPRSPA
ncbi:hypothetical protein LK540_03785 [Massilia sp. IC2-278]|uniref:hypothetical protein n=1 Tax=Massilia sp. IC2-278 TaxID=2887200 RepID=UPI001E4516D8|nr:hypothetical protein [Massilia sp. IC2-278]MCC2959547.1 hypothetical protein [Massilia sp. IC2-278]